MNKTIEFPYSVIQYMRDVLSETLIELDHLDIKDTSGIYCCKSNIYDILEILDE